MDETFDKILRYLDSKDWYVGYNSLCDNLGIQEGDRKYILTKLETEGYIDVERTKTSLVVKISDSGRVFIHETSFCKETENEKNLSKSRSRRARFDISLKILALILTLLTIFLGYKSYTKTNSIKEQAEEIQRLKNELSHVDKTVEVVHLFSNSEKKDTFTIHMVGENILTSHIDFTIKSGSGDTIFHHKFKSQDLIGYGLTDIDAPTISQKETYILRRFYTFFDASNFASPAIPKDKRLDDEFYNAKYFEEIQKQTGSVSFYYLLGEEYMRRIVYLRVQKKVVEFWTCC
jgi:hypothetical protein